MIDVLILGAMTALERELEGEFVVHRASTPHSYEEALEKAGNRIRVIVTYGGGRVIDEALLDRLPRLEIIAVTGVGVESVDLAAARRRNIVVTNVPAASSVDVAEQAIGLLLAAVRGLCEGDRYVRAGLWPEKGLKATRRFSGKLMGILGLGTIGMEIARMAAGFNIGVSYHNRRPRTDVPYRYAATAVDLAREVDYLVVALPGGPSTRHLVNREVLRALGTNGILVNIGRGTAVDEVALIEALTEKWIAGAALDVFENEPFVPPSLMAIPNVVLHPHCGGNTHEANAARNAYTVNNLRTYFAGGQVVARVA